MKRCATATAVLIYEVYASLFSTGILQLDLVELPSSYDETQQLALWPSSSPHSEAPSASEVKSQNTPDGMGSLGHKANENDIVQLRTKHGSAAMVRHGHDVTAHTLRQSNIMMRNEPNINNGSCVTALSAAHNGCMLTTAKLQDWTIAPIRNAQARLRCIDWYGITLELMAGTVYGGICVSCDIYNLSRAVRPGERNSFFTFHPLHDDANTKWRVLLEFASQSAMRHRHNPSFWLDKVCTDQTQIVTFDSPVIAFVCDLCQIVPHGRIDSVEDRSFSSTS